MVGAARIRGETMEVNLDWDEVDGVQMVQCSVLVFTKRIDCHALNGVSRPFPQREGGSLCLCEPMSAGSRSHPVFSKTTILTTIWPFITNMVFNYLGFAKRIKRRKQVRYHLALSHLLGQNRRSWRYQHLNEDTAKCWNAKYIITSSYNKGLFPCS